MEVAEAIPPQRRKQIKRMAPALWRFYGRGYNEVDLISFPKCGRTWLRLLVGHAIVNAFKIDDIPLYRLDEMWTRDKSIPRILVFHEDEPQYKSACQLGTDKRHFEGRKVVFMIRDPRDALVSWYFQLVKRGETNFPGGPFEGTISDLLRHEVGGLETILAYYNIWLDAAHQPDDFLHCYYEDLHADTEAELRRVLRFMGLGSISDQRVQDAIDYCRFDELRRRESELVYDTDILQPTNPADDDTYKFRRGVVGGYRDYLSDADQAYALDMMERWLHPDLRRRYLGD